MLNCKILSSRSIESLLSFGLISL